MANSKLIKKALLVSIFTILFCVTMLISTTFAWFTDTSTVSVKTIKSGSLDVVLEMATDWNDDESVKTWESAKDKTISFRKATGQENKEVIWEPGSSYKLPEIRISNNGNLALKYKIVISGINDNSELNEVIDWTIKLDNQTYVTDKEYKLNAKTDSSTDFDILTIEGAMKDDASNEYQSSSIDNISITVVATQDTVENDSEGNQYDKDADYVPKIPTDKSYIGKYADIDGDGTVDGVIFADLAFSNSGTWGSSNGTWSYSASANLKQYYISQESYTDDFGTAEVIAPVSETSGNDRFYIMALDDVDSNYHYWYHSAYSNKISDYSTVTSENFGSGKQNTTTMIGKWNSSAYGSQNGNSDYTDMWGVIQTQANNGWFVPSRAEWAAFGNAFNITSSNYGSYGLSDYYWPSSLDKADGAYYMTFLGGYMFNSDLLSCYYVRLAKTF